MGTTSLQIIAWTYAVRWEAPGQRPPDAQVFDKTITDQELVHDIQQQFDGLQRGVRGAASWRSRPIGTSFASQRTA